MTGDMPPVPVLSMGQADIAMCSMAKECLRRAFWSIGVRWYDGPGMPPDSHGEFGEAANWPSRQAAAVAWLAAPQNVVPVAQVLSQQAGVAMQDLAQYAQLTLAGEVDAA